MLFIFQEELQEPMEGTSNLIVGDLNTGVLGRTIAKILMELRIVNQEVAQRLLTKHMEQPPLGGLSSFLAKDCFY